MRSPWWRIGGGGSVVADRWWRIGGGGSVVADRWWTAKQVVDLLPIRWSYGLNHDVSSAKITDSMRKGLDTDEIDIGRKDGDVDRALATAAKRIEAIYTVPYLSHATNDGTNPANRISLNPRDGDCQQAH
jgi:CO/xanthine dehydrogenase Mo-binding subunit